MHENKVLLINLTVSRIGDFNPRGGTVSHTAVYTYDIVCVALMYMLISEDIIRYTTDKWGQ